jgi:hypothetical protein
LAKHWGHGTAQNFDLLLEAYEIYQRRSKIKRKLDLAGGRGWKSDALSELLLTLLTDVGVSY